MDQNLFQCWVKLAFFGKNTEAHIFISILKLYHSERVSIKPIMTLQESILTFENHHISQSSHDLATAPLTIGVKTDNCATG